jgi:hypothetical protein
MSSEISDYGLSTLLGVLGSHRGEVSEELVRKCYEIQKKYQYEADRDTPLQIMMQLVEKEISKLDTK